MDAGTQIEWSDCLFDFDVEVEPILDVIVGKILEQSVVELEQEGELSALHNKKVCGVDFVVVCYQLCMLLADVSLRVLLYCFVLSRLTCHAPCLARAEGAASTQTSGVGRHPCAGGCRGGQGG